MALELKSLTKLGDAIANGDRDEAKEKEARADGDGADCKSNKVSRS